MKRKFWWVYGILEVHKQLILSPSMFRNNLLSLFIKDSDSPKFIDSAEATHVITHHLYFKGRRESGKVLATNYIEILWAGFTRLSLLP